MIDSRVIVGRTPIADDLTHPVVTQGGQEWAGVPWKTHPYLVMSKALPRLVQYCNNSTVETM